MHNKKTNHRPRNAATRRAATSGSVAALAREREQAARQHAAQLERANAVLANTIENFSIEQSPDVFLDAIMHTVVSALNVHSVALWRWQDDGYVHLHRVLEDGVVLPGEETDHPHAGRPMFLSDHPLTKEAMIGDKQITEIVPLDRLTDLPPKLIAHLRARGVRAAVTATIRSGNKVIGCFAARLLNGHPEPGPEQLALMRSLAAHGALALEMRRLTEAARAGAIREERARIARDLHDSLAQGFTGIILQLEGVQSALASKDLAKACARADSAGELARDSLQQARSAVNALRPSILEDKDLATALRWLIESTFIGSPVKVQARCNGTARPLSPVVEESLLRIAQEALTNVLKHAHARRVGLSLSYRPDEVILRIYDDGRGFKRSNRRAGSEGGFGLVGIRERADRLGATLTIKNQAGGGASIRVKLPTVTCLAETR